MKEVNLMGKTNNIITVGRKTNNCKNNLLTRYLQLLKYMTKLGSG